MQQATRFAAVDRGWNRGEVGFDLGAPCAQAQPQGQLVGTGARERR